MAAVCIATQAAKMRAAQTTDHRLPRKSATGAANRTPKNVPADEVETTRDCWGYILRFRRCIFRRRTTNPPGLDARNNTGIATEEDPAERGE